MAGSEKVNRAQGIVACICTVIGLGISILIHQMIQKIAGRTVGGLFNAHAPIWMTGFGYMLPGIFGVVAAFLKNRVMYIVQMVIYILILIVMGIFSLISMFAINYLAAINPAQCSSKVCRRVDGIYAMGVTALVMIILGWIFILADTIIVGNILCRRTPAPGVTVQAAPAPVVVVHTGTANATNATTDPALAAVMLHQSVDPRAFYMQNPQIHAMGRQAGYRPLEYNTSVPLQEKSPQGFNLPNSQFAAMAPQAVDSPPPRKDTSPQPPLYDES